MQKRFGVSLEENILRKLDEMVKANKFSNRSQAIRFLFSKYEVQEKWENNMPVAGAIVIVYDHHKRDLTNKLLIVQHDFHELILSVQHVHMDHRNCLESIAVKGKASELQQLADRLIGLKGIKHGKLVMTVFE